MKRCNIILRALSAVMLALGLVLIPLSQAEALPSCEEIAPGATVSECSSTFCGATVSYPFVIVSVYKDTMTRSSSPPYHCTGSRECWASECTWRYYTE